MAVQRCRSCHGMFDRRYTIEDTTIEGVETCDRCRSPLFDTRFVYVEVSSIYALCSTDCARAVAREHRRRRWGRRWRATKQFTLSAVFVGAFLTPHQGPHRPAAIPRAATMHSTSASGPPPLPPGWFGPDWPPTDPRALAALGRDAWIHPLAGPLRRMPRSDSRVFGAPRPGDRPAECRNGHCGVDLGGEIWGEHVHAVHDGVVDWVRRGVNPDRGGQFVRISHRDGTVFTQYFHLAAIPRGLERGTAVKVGQVIGLLGDTGVKESAPHLHFTISVRPGKDWPERYVDPEPLVTLWPLHVPIDGGETGLVNTVALVGTPLGSAPLMPGRQRRLARSRRGAESARSSSEGASAGANAGADPDVGANAEPEARPAAEGAGSATEGE